VSEVVRILVVIVLPQRSFGFLIIILLSMAIMAKYINNNRDSFVDINGFDSEEEGADLEPNDDDSNPTIVEL
jgi:hypothetical protein